jgi:hypothetical protein
VPAFDLQRFIGTPQGLGTDVVNVLVVAILDAGFGLIDPAAALFARGGDTHAEHVIHDRYVDDAGHFLV